MTPSDHPPAPASAPRTGAAGGAASCAKLAGDYLRLWEAIRECAERDDANEENRLRNRAQVVLCRMPALGCQVPRTP